ncbi:nitroreductase family protein [Alicyclobacillus acidiphilus]|uniref:nitroreductase family protein n=1 Tax=Alicyclobacillus acidiphilus TaxID=182455 RepID=UPI00082FECC7|nr:nitroreductase family protein [Alicyclobacillus acidiphilus]
MVTTILNKDVMSAIRDRRSMYALSKSSPISDQEIQNIISEIVQHTPSAFNSQSTRIVLLLRQHHDKLWNIAKEVLQSVQPEEQYRATLDRLNGFEQGYGTVLFFEDQSVIEGLQEKFPKVQDRFPVWSEQTNGMHQLAVWVALEAHGLGASLQHYNPYIDERVKQEWSLPEHWRLVAQMPFGAPTAPPREKVYQSVEERFKVFK